MLLAALAAVGQFASNVYTPSLPFVAADLRKRGHEIERNGKDTRGGTVYRMAKGA